MIHHCNQVLTRGCYLSEAISRGQLPPLDAKNSAMYRSSSSR
jgi:hypothetical protein